MKKGIISILFFVVLLFFGMCVFADASVEFVNCNILQKGILDDSFDSVVGLRVVDINGEEATYKCAQRVRVNGTLCKNNDAIYNAIATDSFAKMAFEDGVVTVLNFSNDSTTYTDVEYKEKKKCFNFLNSKQANLPVYYKYNGDFYPAHFDENHYYDIEVNEYAICITDMKSKTDAEVIDTIEIDSEVGSDFKQTVSVYCEFDAPSGSVLKGELYDEKNILSGEFESISNELFFGNLDNKASTYTIKLWLEDRENNKISSAYVKKYSVNKADIVYGVVLGKGISNDSVDEFVELKTVNTDGVEVFYNCAQRMRVNGRLYKNADDIYSAVEDGAFVKMAVKDGVVKVLNFNSNFSEYENARYDNTTKSFTELYTQTEELPVYYEFDGEFKAAHLDENHYYDIKVYENAILITEMKSKYYDEVINFIEISSKLGSDLKQNIDIMCYSDVAYEVVLKAELYDENNIFLEKTQSTYYNVFFGGLDNETAKYIIKLWYEDIEGNKLSSEYVKEYTVNKTEVKNCFVLQKRIIENFMDECVAVKTSDANGEKTSYICAQRVRVNGNMCKNTEDIYNAIEENVFAVIAIEDGAVTILNFDNNPFVHYDVEYDKETKTFDTPDSQGLVLPVYYKYNGEIVPAYLDENHYYDVEVYDDAVCITDMKSKNGAEVIKYIDTDTVIRSDFTEALVVYCETDSTSYILKGKLYDEKINLIAKAESKCDGFGELVFEDIKNKSENCRVEVWLESEAGEKVSDIYVIQKKLPQNKIKYGNVVFKYTVEDDTPKTFLNVRNIDGTDSVYVCDENTNVINSATAFSLRSVSNEITENSFVKMAVADGVVDTILIEPADLEIYSPEFDYKDELNGEVYVLNNTPETKRFICCTAVYNSLNVMKECDIIEVNISEGDIHFIAPEFSQYEYSNGDYLKIFAWDDEGNMTPLLKAVDGAIVCE